MLIYTDDNYKIIKSYRDYTLINLKGKKENHAHVQKSDTCFLLIKLIKKQIVPKSKYLQDAVLRLTTDEKYIEKILNKQAKNKNKQQYFNVINGK